MRIITLSLLEFPDGVLTEFHVDPTPPSPWNGVPTFTERVVSALRLKAISLGLRERRTPIIPDPPETRTKCEDCASYEFGLRLQIEALQKENEQLTEKCDALVDTLIKAYSASDWPGSMLDREYYNFLTTLLSPASIERGGFAHPETDDFAERVRKPFVKWIDKLREHYSPYISKES